MNTAAVVILAVLVLLLYSLWQRSVRADYIRRYVFPPGLYEKLRKKRPELATKDCQLVGQALRQFFLAYLRGNFRYVSMPSQVVDDLWHELILYTRHYDAFCKKAFGRFLHHTPAVVLGKNRQNNTGLRRVWWHTCREENINPREPSRLPLLFAIDNKLNIGDGFVYIPDCSGLPKRTGDNSGAPYCGGDFSNTDFDGTTDGFGDGSGHGTDGGDSSDGGGCGGGCGGD
jgi:hypothetical protein